MIFRLRGTGCDTPDAAAELMSQTDIAYARLVTTVWLYGFGLALERMDQWLAGFEPRSS